MRRNSNMNHVQKDSTAVERVNARSPRSGRKTPGTRLGILQDWRGEANKSARTSVGVGKAFRDGR
jgi:hypothetical protein